MKIGNEIDHLGLAELEHDYSRQTTLKECGRAVGEGLLGIALLLVLFLLLYAVAVWRGDIYFY